MKPDGHVKILCALVNLRGRERNGAFGLDARVGKMGRGSADSTKSGVERWHFKFSKDASFGEAKSAGACAEGNRERNGRKSWRQGQFESGNSKGHPFGAGLGRRKARSVILLGVSEAVSGMECCTIRPRRGQGVDQRMVQKRNAAAAHESSQVGLHLGSASLIKCKAESGTGELHFISLARWGRQFPKTFATET